MNKVNLDVEGDFLVKESKTLNFIIGTILIGAFFISLLFGDFGWSNFIAGMGLLLIPGAWAMAMSRRTLTIMKINKDGFFHCGKLISNWQSFYEATVEDKRAVGSFTDNYILQFRYYSSDRSLIYTRSIPLTSTQDKGEKEIIDAIRFYWTVGRDPISKPLSIVN